MMSLVKFNSSEIKQQQKLSLSGFKVKRDYHNRAMYTLPIKRWEGQKKQIKQHEKSESVEVKGLENAEGLFRHMCCVVGTLNGLWNTVTSFYFLTRTRHAHPVSLPICQHVITSGETCQNPKQHTHTHTCARVCTHTHTWYHHWF